jgi:hypothetical protein
MKAGHARAVCKIVDNEAQKFEAYFAGWKQANRIDAGVHLIHEEIACVMRRFKWIAAFWSPR